MRMKFTVHEKQLKAQLGAAYDLAKYTEGVDYRRQKTGFGSRVMFRADIVDASSFKCNPSADLNVPSGESSDLNADHIVLSVVDPAIVEHKQALEPIIVPVTAVKTEEAPVITRPGLLDGAVRTAMVVKKHQNQRWVETDTLGRVFVGSKGNQIKLNQFIPVQNGSLFLGDIGQGIGNVLNH
jgi:hypothetical protein